MVRKSVWEGLWRNEILPVSHRDRRDGLESGMRVCTWGTGEQERGRVCWLQARAVPDQSRVYFPQVLCRVQRHHFEQNPSRGYFLVCSTLWTTYADRDGLCDGGEEYKGTGLTAITGEAWSVEGFMDEILENVLGVFIEPDLRLYFLRRRLQAHRHCCLTWIFCVKWNMRDIEVLHG